MIALFLFIFLLNFQEVCKIDYIKENLRVESCKPSCCVTSKQYLEKLQPSKCWHYCTGTTFTPRLYVGSNARTYVTMHHSYRTTSDHL